MVCTASIGAADRHPGAAKLRQVCGVDRQADRFAVDDGVERAAERDVDEHLPLPDRDRQAAVQHERRHIHERDALDSELYWRCGPLPPVLPLLPLPPLLP